MFSKIGNKIVITQILIISILVFCIVTYINSRTSRIFENELMNRVKLISASIAERLNKPMMNKDNDTIMKIIEETEFVYPDISYILIFDESGNLVSSIGDIETEQLKKVSTKTGESVHTEKIEVGDEIYIDATSPILEGLLGNVRVGISREIIAKDIRRSTYTIIIFSIVIMVISIIISVAISRGITGRITELTNIADRISKGDTDITIPIKGNDELTRLAESFNRMLTSLKVAMKMISRR